MRADGAGRLLKTQATELEFAVERGTQVILDVGRARARSRHTVVPAVPSRSSSGHVWNVPCTRAAMPDALLSSTPLARYRLISERSGISHCDGRVREVLSGLAPRRAFGDRRSAGRMRAVKPVASRTRDPTREARAVAWIASALGAGTAFRVRRHLTSWICQIGHGYRAARPAKPAGRTVCRCRGGVAV